MPAPADIDSDPLHAELLDELALHAAARSTSDPLAADDLFAVGVLIADRLRALNHGWTQREIVCHNVFLAAMGPELVRASALSRGLTSRLGNTLEALAFDLARLRFGQHRVPRVAHELWQPATGEFAAPAKDAIIVTTLPRDVLRTNAQALTSMIMSPGRRGARAPIGSVAFEEAYIKAIDTVNAARGTGPSWALRVDLLVRDPTVGIIEMKAGGALDNSKAEKEIEFLVAAGLALGDPEIPLRFAVAYANRGEGQRPSGSLPRCFADGCGRLSVGRDWWQRLLPDTVDFEDMMALFGRCASLYSVS